MRGKWDNAFNAKPMDNVRKETHVVSAKIRHLETGAMLRAKGQSSSPAPTSKARTDGETPLKVQATEEKAFQTKRGRVPCRCRKCNYPLLAHSRVLKNTSLRRDASMATNTLFEKVHSKERRKFGSNHAVKFTKRTWHQIKILERNGLSRGIIHKCEPHERSPCAPSFEERTPEETLLQERCARTVAWDLAEHVYKLKK